MAPFERYMVSVANSEKKEGLEIKPLGFGPWRSLAQVVKKKFQYLKHKFLPNFLQKITNDQHQKIKYSDYKWDKRNIGPMRASTRSNRVKVGLGEGRSGLRSPKTWNSFWKKYFSSDFQICCKIFNGWPCKIFLGQDIPLQGLDLSQNPQISLKRSHIYSCKQSLSPDLAPQSLDLAQF